METFLIITGIACIALVYVVVFFTTAHIIYQRALARCNNRSCMCDGLGQPLHSVPATVGALLWPIYWLFRLGRRLSNFSYANWKKKRRSTKAERELEALRLIHAKAALLRKEELAKIEHTHQMAIQNQAILDEHTGISKATRLLNTPVV